MPLFASLFAGLFGSLAAFFGTWVTKKVAFGVAAVAVFGTLTVTFLAVIAGAIATALAVSSLPAMVSWAIWYFLPSSLPACAAAVLAADVSLAIYRWNIENLKILAYVT